MRDNDSFTALSSVLLVRSAGARPPSPHKKSTRRKRFLNRTIWPAAVYLPPPEGRLDKRPPMPAPGPARPQHKVSRSKIPQIFLAGGPQNLCKQTSAQRVEQEARQPGPGGVAHTYCAQVFGRWVRLCFGGHATDSPSPTFLREPLLRRASPEEATEGALQSSGATLQRIMEPRPLRFSPMRFASREAPSPASPSRFSLSWRRSGSESSGSAPPSISSRALEFRFARAS